MNSLSTNAQTKAHTSNDQMAVTPSPSDSPSSAEQNIHPAEALADQSSSVIATDQTSPDHPAAETTEQVTPGVEPALPEFFSELEPLIDLLEIGGPVVWILTILSVVALSIILLKLWQLAVLKPESLKDVRCSLDHWSIGDTQQALNSLHENRPVSKIVRHAMDGLSQSQDLALLKDELTRLATNHLNQLRALLRPLEVIASLSPLLGLMGTVLGMIVAFQQMEAAGSQVDPSVLSGGIWQALLTTAVGLAVAIPVAAAHSWLERKAERATWAINDAVTQVFTRYPSPTQPATVWPGVTSSAA